MPSDSDIGSAKARHLAAETFVEGFPLVLMDVVRRAHPMAPRLTVNWSAVTSAAAPVAETPTPFSVVTLIIPGGTVQVVTAGLAQAWALMG